MYLARANLLLGNYEDCEKILLSVLKENPRHEDANLSLGKLYVVLSKWNKAQDSLLLALEVEPNNYVALANLASVWLRRDADANKSIDFLNRAIAINGSDYRVYFELGVAYFYGGNHMAAKHAFQEAEILNPRIDHRTISQIYFYYQHYDWAAIAIEKSLALSPNIERPILTKSQIMLAACEYVIKISFFEII